MAQECESTWVISNLWKDKALFKTKLNLPDTLLADSNSRYTMMWLFTDSAGYIKRKKEEHSKLENIVLHFIGPNKQLSQEATQQNEDMIMASYILDNEYHLLTQQQTILKITGGLAKSESVQMLPRPNGDVTSRLLTEVKKTDGRFVYKFWKLYENQGKLQRILLCGIQYKRCLTQMSDAAIESIQKNSNSMVFEINFIFLEDEMLKIWILGSDHCVVRPIKPISKILKENTSHANLKHDYKFGRPKRKNCPGNFCNFVIKSKARMDKDEMDYDDLLGEVRKVYFNGLEHEYTRMKLSMRSDYLLKERAIQNMKKLKNEIPYKYIILGRLLIEKSGISTNKKHLIEIDANQLRKSLFLKESEITTDLNDLKWLGLKNPFHYYDTVQVCERCYEVYKLLRPKSHEESEAKFVFDKDMPHPSKRLVSRASLLTQTSTPRLGTFKSGHNKLELSAVERRRSSVITPIGKIDKDNLNDLLADMSHLLLEEEVGSRILAQNLHYFSRNAKKSVDLTAETTNRRGSILLDTKKVTNTNFEALTMKLFPDANLKFNFRNKDKKSFKNYLNCLKSDRYD